jgi:hypothetical protein
MSPDKIKQVLDEHEKWVNGTGGTFANLSGAGLTRADLSRANLSGAGLTRADLSRANLSGADLSRANLSGADLTGANLFGANLSGANLYHADLTRAKITDKDTLIGGRPFLQIGPIGSRSACLHAYITDNGIMVRTGCFFGTLAEFSAKVKDTYKNTAHGKEYMAAVALIKVHAKLWTPK